MSEHRKIVLILGNGFDLDLGLKTSYKAFWEYDFLVAHHIDKHFASEVIGKLAISMMRLIRLRSKSGKTTLL